MIREKISNREKFYSTAVIQIFLIILSIFSFSFLIGGTERVSAQVDPSCLGLVCQQDPFCCDLLEWDAACQAVANNICEEAGLGSPFPSLPPLGLPNPSKSGGQDKAKAETDVTDGDKDNAKNDAIEGDGEKTDVLGALFTGLITAAFVGGVVYFLADAFGADSGLSEALGLAAGAGVFTYSLLTELTSIGGTTAGLIGLGVGALVFILLYEEVKVQRIQFQCLPFESPLGGSDCEKCNEDPFRPCSEYRCRSLGQACEIVNPGTEEEKCVWVNPNDVTSPTITPWPDALTEGLSYKNHDTRPPSLGTKIIRDGAANGCLQAFTPLEFGIVTNEAAQCKIDNLHTDNLDEMQFYFGETNFFLNNHTQKLSLPSPDAINAEAPELENDGIYDFFVRCRDANGNENVDEFVFNFCVDPSPDTTPPIISDTSILSGSPVAFGIGEIDVSVFVNEPAECRWSIQDKNYEEMEHSVENGEVKCSTSVTEINAELLYECSTTLTGIVDKELNKYFFRCKDQPNKPENERNVNVQSFPFTLRGTEPLDIISAGPNGTVTGSTEVVTVDLSVETSNGADEGISVCYFSDTGVEGSYVQMFETNSFEHKQTLQLAGGNYDYFFRCIDAGGNSDEESTEFTVFVDTQAPLITRAYRELDALKIVTNEDAECSYSLNSCNFNFDEGIPLIYSNPSIKTNHFSPWTPNLVYYIKCKDNFGNEPSPSECSLIASATNIV